MPIYEFECPKCNNVFQEIRSIKSESRVATCDECGEENARKIISSSDFHLQGRGWAKDGYAGKYDNFKQVMHEI